MSMHRFLKLFKSVPALPCLQNEAFAKRLGLATHAIVDQFQKGLKVPGPRTSCFFAKQQAELTRRRHDVICQEFPSSHSGATWE